MLDHERHSLAGVSVSPLSAQRALDLVAEALEGQETLSITVVNPDYLRKALQDDDLRKAVNAFDVVLTDGNGVRPLAPLFGFRIPERVDTDSFAPRVFDLLARRCGRVFLFGCAPGVAQAAAARLAKAYPSLLVVGTDHGFYDAQRGHPGRFDESDSIDIAARIRLARPDLVLVSLPTPLQQQWVADYGGDLGARVVMTAGSYLDHIAENPNFPALWYPNWVNRFKLNWAYRLLREPRRLWRRYTVEYLDLVWRVLRIRFGRPD